MQERKMGKDRKVKHVQVLGGEKAKACLQVQRIHQLGSLPLVILKKFLQIYESD